MTWFACQIALLLFFSTQTKAKCNGTLSGSTVVDDFTVEITMDCATETIEFHIEYNNFDNHWFGIVFHHHMSPHPSLVYTTGKDADRPQSLYSYYLQAESLDDVVYDPDNDWTEIHKSTSDNTVTLIYEQHLSKTEWDTSTTSIGFRFATGTSLQLTQHNHKSAHTEVHLLSTPNILTTEGTESTLVTVSTHATTDEAAQLDVCGSNDEAVTNGRFDDFEIILTINCVEETIQIDITYNAFQNNWFGLVFNDEMLGNALIYTTGKANSRPNGLYSYSITAGHTAQNVGYNEGSNWNKIESSVESQEMHIIYQQELSKTDWDIYTKEIAMRWAVGSPDTLNLVYHADRSLDTKHYSFISGGSRTEKDDLSLQYAHGIIMWTVWCVLASIGIMSSAFRWLFPSTPKGGWFKMHRTVQSVVVLLHLIAFIIAIIFVQDSGVGHFSNSHMIMGLVVTILVILQPLNALFRPHPAALNEKKPRNRFIWELMHKSCGYISWILAMVTAYLGFNLPIIHQELLGFIHLFGWCLFIFIVYIAFTMIGCSINKKESHVRVADGIYHDESDQLEEESDKLVDCKM